MQVKMERTYYLEVQEVGFMLSTLLVAASGI
jgi:hypothetical protein